MTCPRAAPSACAIACEWRGVQCLVQLGAGRDARDSHQPSFGHADALGTHDDVVQDSYPYQAQCIAQLVRDRSVGRTGLSNATWVVMRQDDCARVDAKRGPYHLAWVNTRAVDGAGEELLAVDDAMPVVQPENVEFFMRQGAEAHA